MKWNKKDKIRVLLELNGKIHECVLHPDRISPDGSFVKVGGYFADTLTGWFSVDVVQQAIVSVLETMTGGDAPPAVEKIIPIQPHQ